MSSSAAAGFEMIARRPRVLAGSGNLLGQLSPARDRARALKVRFRPGCEARR